MNHKINLPNESRHRYANKGWNPARAAAMLLAVVLLIAQTAGCREAAGGSTATPAPTAARIALATDITVYSLLMSSAFGIHIFATDGGGNPVKGKWTATWGQFCTASNQNGGWKIGEPRAEWEDASDIWWQFPLEQNPNGEMPSAVSIMFEGGGGKQTLLLEKSGELTVKVNGTAAGTASAAHSGTADGNATLNVTPSAWRPAVSSAGGIRLRAFDESGAALAGDWSTGHGLFVLPPIRNGEGGVSLPDQQPVREMKGISEVQWFLPQDELQQGGVYEIRFTNEGKVTVLLLNYDSDMGLVTIGLRFAAFSEDEVRIVKEFSAMVMEERSPGELIAYTRGNIGKLNNGFGEVLADAVLNQMINSNARYTDYIQDLAASRYDTLSNLTDCDDFKKVKAQVDTELAEQLQILYNNGYMVRFEDGNVYAGINWALLKAAFAGKEGGELEQYIDLMQLEDEKPFVLEGLLEITTDELARRCIAAHAYVQTYPIRADWHDSIGSLRDAYLSSLLTLNGMLFSGDGFTVPEEQKTAFDGLIAQYADDELGKLMAEYKALLASNGWALTDAVRDFLTQHGVPGYGRLANGCAAFFALMRHIIAEI